MKVKRIQHGRINPACKQVGPPADDGSHVPAPSAPLGYILSFRPMSVKVENYHADEYTRLASKSGHPRYLPGEYPLSLLTIKRTLLSSILIIALYIMGFLVSPILVRAEDTPSLHPGPVVDLTSTNLQQPGPIGAVTFSPWGDLYALEMGGQRLLHFSPEGKLLETTGGFGFGEGSTRHASDITIAGFEIWISDSQAGRIVRFDRWLTPLEPFTETVEGASATSFERPVSVARSSSGIIVLLEQDRQELLYLDPEGRLIERVASYGESFAGMQTPTRVEVSQSGRIAVADPGSQSLILLDRFGSITHQTSWLIEGEGPLGMSFNGEFLMVCGENGIILYSPEMDELMRWGRETTGGGVSDIAFQGKNVALAVGTTLRMMILDGVR